MTKTTPSNTIPFPRAPRHDRQGVERNPLLDFVRALARRQARLDALPPPPANDSDPTSRE